MCEKVCTGYIRCYSYFGVREKVVRQVVPVKRRGGVIITASHCQACGFVYFLHLGPDCMWDFGSL